VQVADSPDDIQFGLKFQFERILDGIKTAGTANGTGLIASGAALNYFADKHPHITPFIKGAAYSFTFGIFMFGFSMMWAIVYPAQWDAHIGDIRKRTRNGENNALENASVKKADRKLARSQRIMSLFGGLSAMAFFFGLAVVWQALSKL
jgi:hypothetical protein